MDHKGKIAIISYITHSSHLNYGATLHGFAFQHFLRSKGANSTIIDYFPKALNGENLKYPILNKRKGRSYISWFIVKINWLIGFTGNISKYNKFERFKRKYLTLTDMCYDYEQLKSCTKIDGRVYNKFVCEADVIWKISSMDSIDENFFMTFPAANNAKKIAYAPTVSSKSLEGIVLEKFKNYIKPFYAISTREKKGASYLSSILDRKVVPVLDPTLLLDANDYEKVLSNPGEKDYLLIYNCTVNDIKMVKESINFARKNNLKVIEISNYALNRFVVWHNVKVNVGIEEWLGYIKNAKVICTNSFHGLCFSVIFKKIYSFSKEIIMIIECKTLLNH